MWCFNYIHTQIRVHDREKDLRKQVDGIQEKNKNVNTGTSISIHVKKNLILFVCAYRMELIVRN